MGGVDGQAPPELVGRLVWIVHYAGPIEVQDAGPIGPDGRPQPTVFVYRDYLVAVDALDGRVVVSLLR